MMDAKEAQAALAAMDTSREKIAQLMEQTPLWRHLAFGAVLSAICATTALGTAGQAIGTALGLTGVFLLLQHDRKTYGAWVSGFRKGRTLPLTMGLIAAMLGAILIGMRFRGTEHATAAAAIIGCAVFIVATAASMGWSRIYVRELRRGGA